MTSSKNPRYFLQSLILDRRFSVSLNGRLAGDRRVLVRKARAINQNAVTDTDKDTEESKLEFLEILGCQGGFSKLGSLFWGNWGIYMTVTE